MKRSLFITAICLFAALLAKAETVDLTLGYCADEISNSIGTGNATSIVSAAINLSNARFGKYAGSEIKEIQVGLNTAVTDLSVFIKDSLTGEDIYSQEVGATPRGWNTITLDKAFTLPDTDLYIGYTCTGSASPIGLSGETISDACWLRATTGGTWYDQESQKKGSLCIRAVLDGKTISYTDIEFESLAHAYGEKGKDFYIKGKAYNHGAHTVSNFIVNYSIDGGALIRKEVEATLPPQGSGNFAFVANAINESGEYSVNVSIISVEGKEDEGTDSNTIAGNISILPKTYPKKAVMEEGTGTWCTWCPRGIVGMEMMKEKYPETFIGIAVHNKDAMTVDIYDSALGGITGLSYPSCAINRKTTGDPYEDVEELFLNELDILSPAGISLIADFEDESKKRIKAKTTTTFGFSSSGSSAYRLAYVLLENKVGGYEQVNGYSGGPIEMGGFEKLPNPASIDFNDVARGIYPSFTGLAGSIPSTIEEGVGYENSYTISIPSSVQSTDYLELVVLLIETKTGYIINADKVDLPSEANNLENITDSFFIRNIYKKGNSLCIETNREDELLRLDLFNLQGNKILTETVSKKGNIIELPLSVSQGIYILQMTTTNGNYTQKIIF